MVHIAIDNGSAILTGQEHIQVSIRDQNGSGEHNPSSSSSLLLGSAKSDRSGSRKVPQHGRLGGGFKGQSTGPHCINDIGQLVNGDSPIRGQFDIDQNGFPHQTGMKNHLGRLGQCDLTEFEYLDTVIVVTLFQGDGTFGRIEIREGYNAIGDQAGPVQ